MSDDVDPTSAAGDDVAPSDGTGAGDSVSAFAEDLRTLRHDAGNPTLSRMEREAHVSKSVVSEALAGRRLPSERTVRSVVGLLRGDVPSWVARRNALAAVPAAQDPAVPDPAVQDPASAATVTGEAAAVPARRLVPLSVTLIAVVAALAVGIGGTLAVQGSKGASAQAGVGSTASGEPSFVPPQIAVKTGVDPADTACLKDAHTATGETGAHGALLEIIYSKSCHAAWARITRYDNLSTGNEVSAAIYRQIAPNSSDRQSTTEPDAQSAYTTLIVRPTPLTQICAVGSFTVAGKTISWGDPICL